MLDGFGRELDYLRLSLTDKCNLRCRYCMPKEGVKRLAHSDILTFEEIARLVSNMVSLGIKKVRLTGGEPLVRKGVTSLIRELREIPGLKEVSMTTNGSLLAGYAEELKAAGLSGVNISLDTLRQETFLRLTGSDELPNVLSGIKAAREAGLSVKLNCVPIRGINDNDIIGIAEIARGEMTDVRFIELMPLGCGNLFEGIPSDEILKKLEESYGEARLESTNPGAGPATYYRFQGFKGRVGFISPLSHQFCRDCNRLRLTAEGFLKLCLQYPTGVDLKTPLRSGCTNEELKKHILEAVQKKPAAHSFGQVSQGTEARPTEEKKKMVQIGG